MTKAKLRDHREALIKWALRHGYRKDRFGHYVKEVLVPNTDGTIGGITKKYRIQINQTAMKREVQVHHPATAYSKASNSWVRLSSGYLKNISINAEDKLVGLSRDGCQGAKSESTPTPNGEDKPLSGAPANFGGAGPI